MSCPAIVSHLEDALQHYTKGSSNGELHPGTERDLYKQRDIDLSIRPHPDSIIPLITGASDY